jgi:phospholipase/lecithinase/hemolysin
VTNPVGLGNKLLGGANAVLGQLTVPVTAQIDRHLARKGGAFRGDEAVFVLAGGTDLVINLATLTPAAAVTAMGKAGAELASYINTKITGKGAKYVVVVNLPDISISPLATANEVTSPGSKALTSTMVTTFNSQLQSGIAGNANVLYVDAYTISRDQVANPSQYGLTNATVPACNLAAPSPNALGSSLVCTSANVMPGVVDKYLFADTLHLTPYGYQLLAQLVSSEMAKKGWL